MFHQIFELCNYKLLHQNILFQFLLRVLHFLQNFYILFNRHNEFINPNIKPLYRFFEKFLIDNELKLIEIEPVHNNKYYDKLENRSKLMEYEELNEDLDLDW